MKSSTKVTLTLGQLKRLVKESNKGLLQEDEELPEEVVGEFEERLRTARDEVEAAARLVCSSHNKAARQAWNALYRLSDEIAGVIHTTHLFRKWD